MVMYTERMLAALKGKRKRRLWAMIAVAAAGIAVCAVLACLLDRSNKIPVAAAACAVSIACGWAVLGILFAEFLPLKARIAHTRAMLTPSFEGAEGVVKSCGGSVTISRYLTAAQVTVSGGRLYALYWDDALGDCPLRVGSRVKLRVCRNFICAYEVCGDGE